MVEWKESEVEVVVKSKKTALLFECEKFPIDLFVEIYPSKGKTAYKSRIELYSRISENDNLYNDDIAGDSIDALKEESIKSAFLGTLEFLNELGSLIGYEATYSH